ncbi:putative metalloregulatory protein [Rosellinia necatrix]|uniref:Putative metalloregulatory protein n=1 Tax=Rosellinia necatrix TaxID=77044 RepID=A0A1W2TDX0_ROSNE|nr:putative metalloregulatory protein [Rosellinia necatrix]
MDNDFFNTGPDEFFLDDSSNSANGFSSMTGIPSSNSAHVGDASSQFVHSSSWWDESLAFGELDPSGLQSNGLQSADLQHIPHASHDRALYKSYPSGHNMQASPQDVFLGVPGITNAHSRGAAPWIPFPYRQNSGPITPRESECQGMYKNSPILEHQEFIQGSQDISTFGDDFGGGNNVPIPALSPNQFTAADLGRIPQPQNADDTASLAYTQASCNSKCTSSVCENENCSVTGIPCDDPACVENDLSTGVLNLANQAPTQVTAELAVFRPLHTQPCNHTESEHIVARTLGELRAPAELDALEKTSYTSSFDYTLVTRAGEQFYDYYQPYPTPSQPPTEVESFASHDPRIPSQSNSPLLIPPSVVDNPERHICKWIAQGERTICGAEFTNTKDFHDHLCEFHIDKLPSQAGCACLWSGCPRGQDRPFGTRGKLRRHISTHSVCKQRPIVMASSVLFSSSFVDALQTNLTPAAFANRGFPGNRLFNSMRESIPATNLSNAPWKAAPWRLNKRVP